MTSETTQGSKQLFIGYFEEPEPGVPDGYTGWYHSGGKFPVESAQQVFTSSAGRRTQLCDNVVGPFSCRDEALMDLQGVLSD